MPTNTRSTQVSKTKPAAGKKAATKKPLPVKKQAAPGKALPVEALKKTIAYFFLLSYCPPGEISNFKRITAPFRTALAESAGMSEAAYFKKAIPEVCRRIVAFHEGTRQPGQDWIDALERTAPKADQSPRNLFAFQEEMSRVARLKPRALPENRLHRKKGCQFCRLPCYYGYFTLVSDPQFGRLRELMAAEAQKPVAEQSPLSPIYGFTFQHLAGLIGAQEVIIQIEHLVNLSYCLMMLGTAKSRMALPEEQLRLFQVANQAFIRRARTGTRAPQGPQTR
jgi:hypothetical protein